ncbi:MAG: hypothetical protein ABIR30_12105 [Chitinophagaceae bacterium]
MAAPKKYRMDKTAFKIQSFEEANDHFSPWVNKTTAERLDAACYLICMAFRVTPYTKLDKTVFSKRKHA